MNNGKKICYKGRKIRAEIAKEFDIEGFEFKECDLDCKCDGECSITKDEAKELEWWVCLKLNKSQIEDGDIKCLENRIREYPYKKTPFKLSDLFAPMDIFTPQMGGIGGDWEVNVFDSKRLDRMIDDKKPPRGIKNKFRKKDDK